MFFKQFFNEGLGCCSYMVGCAQAGVVAVVDPRRDIGDYLTLAHQEGLKITQIIDTHVHADHITGSQELQRVTEAPIYVHGQAPVKYEHQSLQEGQELVLGSARLQILDTPGHTPHSVSVLVTDTSRGIEPWLVLTGDLLFVGDVGRPDLAGAEKLEEQVENLYHSLYDKLGRFPGRLEIYPAHGHGSLCGRALSSKLSSTLGFERHNNPILQKGSLAEFKAAVMQEFPARPKNFTHIIATNLAGPPLVDQQKPFRPLNVQEVKAKLDSGHVIVDTRDEAAFGGAHIPGSINIGLSPPIGNWAGMVLEPGSPLVLIVDNQESLREVVKQLYRVGYDNIEGFLSGGIKAWEMAAQPTGFIPQLTPRELAEMLKAGKPDVVLDVRTAPEWQQGHIAEAQHLPLSQMSQTDLSPYAAQKVVTICGNGYRANIAGSLLMRHGAKRVSAVAGGMVSWRNAGLPTSI
ncbi:MAG: MBL fold metallo-hydrolase [Desulfobacca sp. 4484_104]|nr:MAG: MBL fold metallo-hydrolase [Desulfobacca sp. 4484_104]RLA90618.1 MAG: MBL fold metallo-hydrolase [Deltaproteobacteria bacterium]